MNAHSPKFLTSVEKTCSNHIAHSTLSECRLFSRCTSQFRFQKLTEIFGGQCALNVAPSFSLISYNAFLIFLVRFSRTPILEPGKTFSRSIRMTPIPLYLVIMEEYLTELHCICTMLTLLNSETRGKG